MLLRVLFLHYPVEHRAMRLILRSGALLGDKLAIGNCKGSARSCRAETSQRSKSCRSPREPVIARLLGLNKVHDLSVTEARVPF